MIKIKKEPPKATDRQKQAIRDLASQFGLTVEDIVCINTCYRTTSLDQIYSYEARKVIEDMKQVSV